MTHGQFLDRSGIYMPIWGTILSVLHVNYSRGFLSLEAFRLIVNDERMKCVPMILETPAPEQEIWAEEIKLLYWMVGKDTGDPELLGREKVLQAMGKEDREKQLDAMKRKAEKQAKASGRKKKRGGISSEGESGESEEEEHVH
jgi:AP endonuclease 1